MCPEYVESLIESILQYDTQYKPPFFIVFFIPSNEKYGINYETYLTILAATAYPSPELIDVIMAETKKHLGNVIYAADFKILEREKAIEDFSSMLE